MIRLFVKASMLGSGPARLVEVPPAPGLTIRNVLELARAQQEFGEAVLTIAVDGRLVDVAEYDQPLPDGSQVVVGIAVHGIEIGTMLVYALVAAAVSAAVGYGMSLLTPRPKQPGVPQQRGDQESATFAWDGITTSYGQGLVIPIIAGRHLTGGQVIYTDVFASSIGTTGQRELLRMIVAIGEGPTYRIGNTVVAEQNGLGGFVGDPSGSGGLVPSDISVNGNLLDATNTLPGAKVWLRPGTLNQSVLPSNPFRGVTTTFTVGEALNVDDSEAIYTLVGTESVTTVSITLAFPSGIYAQDSSGNIVAAPVRFWVHWRFQGDNTWRYFYRSGQLIVTQDFGSVPIQGFAADSFGADLRQDGGAEPGPIEIRVRRLAPAAPLPSGTQAVNQCTWRQIGVNLNQPIAYAGVGLLGLELLATGRLQGALPQIRARVDGHMVKVWDQSLGWSPYCWDKPAAPFNWMTNPPGRNPAWFALRFLLEPWGLGRYESEATIDLPSFRRWSILCDQDPNPGAPWGEAAFCFDSSIDASKPAWDTFLAICAAGRASPVRINGKIGVVYQYRDAHSDSLVAVPARTSLQLFTSGNVQDLQVEWLNRSNRPTAYQFQFLNEDKNWAQDVVTVEDIESDALQDPTSPTPEEWRPETVQAFGVTRESQLRREGLFMHRINRLVRRMVTFKTGPWALASTVNDVISVETDVLRPFAADVPMSCAVRGDVAASNLVTVDHVVTGTGLQLVVRGQDGTPIRATINSVSAVAGGTLLTLATSITCDGGAAAVVGKVSKLTEDYQIVGIGLAQDMLREVRALQWVPGLFDPVGSSDFGFAGAPVGLGVPPQASPEPTDAADIAVQPMREGGYLVTWSRQVARSASMARVWVQDQAVGVWWLAGESRTGQLQTRSMAPWRQYVVAISVEDGFGVFSPPEVSDQLAFTAEEFPPQAPPPIRKLTVQPVAGGMLCTWPGIDTNDLDHYELRVGAEWTSGRLVWRGLVEQVLIPTPPGAVTWWVAARSTSGLYGLPAAAAVTAWSPPGMLEKAGRDELATTPSGTSTGLTYDGAGLTLSLSTAVYLGTYQTLSLDAGFLGPWFWQVRWDALVYDAGLVDAETGLVGDGEAAWSSVSLRPASSGRPGIAVLDDIVDNEVGLVGDLPDTELAGVGAGEPGAAGAVTIESRLSSDGSTWSIWARHVDGAATGRYLQVRATLERAGDLYTVQLTQLQLKAFI